MITAIIVDDEQNCIDTLKWKLENFTGDVKVAETFVDPVKALKYLNSNEQPDILFLDIEMPNLNGFDLLESLKNVDFEVIFTTAYDQYGIQAVKFSALDYLLKPVRNKELVEALERYRNRSTSRNPRQQVESLLSNLKSQTDTGKLEKITLATKESLELVDPDQITYCESDSNYTMVHLEGERRKLISRTLREFDEMLSPYNFCRVHHSYLVNINHVREFVKSEGGYLILKNGKQVPVSKSKKENLLTHFQN